MKYESIKNMFENENDTNFEMFKGFIKEFGLDDDFYDITSKHTEERLKALIAAEVSEDNNLSRRLLLMMQESKSKREEQGKTYPNNKAASDSQLEKLYKNLSSFINNSEKHNKKLSHEKQTLEKWLREIENDIK